MKERNANDEKIKEVTEILEDGIKELFESERYRQYLKIMSKFHNYSFQNSLLISLQCPNATKVAGYTTWKRDFHRQVKKGEHGIRILAPAPYRVSKDIEKIDPITNKPELGVDGEPIKIRKEVLVPAYKITSVFDVTQTDGEPLPEIATELKGTVDNFDDLLRSIENISPVPIEFKEVEGTANGYYSYGEKKIVIRKDMDEQQSLKTAIHELGHALMHDSDIMKEEKNRKQKEVEAESVAFVVCNHYGLDTSEYSFGYIAGWSSDKELSELKESMNYIREISSNIINKMDREMKLLEKDYRVTFYVAECAEYHDFGEYFEFETLQQAMEKYKEMENEGPLGGKQLGVIYHDNKEEFFDQMELGLLPELQKEILDRIPKFQECEEIKEAILAVEAHEKKDLNLEKKFKRSR